MTLRELRSHFPHTDEQIYLNHAATSPLSTPVMRAIEGYLEQRHRENIENYFDFEPVLESARRRLADLVNAPVERVEFAPNTSYALNVLAQGLDWQRGDRVAVPGCEFPANVYPFMNLQSRGVEVDFIPHHQGVVRLEDIDKTLRPKTRLLTISWVQFLSGYRIDLRAVGKLCKERGIIFCVDAIQGLGAFGLDVAECGIDFLACGGHKWLMAAQGSGFLYVTEELQQRISPMAGWLHGPVDWQNFFDYELEFHPDATRFRLGTMNNIGITSLDAALKLREEADPAWCAEHVVKLSTKLREGLETLGIARYGSDDIQNASGIVTLEHPKVESLHEKLLERSIEGALRQRKLRFSPTYYNSEEEIDRVLDAIERFAGTS